MFAGAMFTRWKRVSVIIEALDEILIDCGGLRLCFGAFGFGIGFLALEKGFFGGGAQFGGQIWEVFCHPAGWSSLEIALP